MISIVQGSIFARLNDALIVMVGGVGLRVLVPQPLLKASRVGELVLLHTHLVVREDDLSLIGFATEDELDLFHKLITVSGVGPKLALSVLSNMAPDALRMAIGQEHADMLAAGARHRQAHGGQDRARAEGQDGGGGGQRGACRADRGGCGGDRRARPRWATASWRPSGPCRRCPETSRTSKSGCAGRCRRLGRSSEAGFSGLLPMIITSTANRHVVEARKLRQRKHREDQGRFLVEGLQLLTMALDSGRAPAQVFYCPPNFTGPQGPLLIERFDRSTPVELFEVTPQVMAALSEREGPQGIVASFPLFTTPLPAFALHGAKLVLVLDRPQDPGNLGGLIRTADAVGATGVVILEPAVDLFDPKAIRASMGSLFNLPIASAADAGAALRYLDGKGIVPVGASEHAASLQSDPWGTTALRGGCALILGNEARGLSPDVTPHIRRWVSLPMRGKAESLNVGVAGGVLMYLWLRANEM